MYEFYGFDPKTLTNEELFDKQMVLTSKRLMAARFGKVEAANQLQLMIQAIEFERKERMFNEHIGAKVLKSSPVVIETEVDLQERESVAEEPKPTKHSNRPIRRAVRTATPVVPSNDSGNHS